MTANVTAAQAGWRLSRYNVIAWSDDLEGAGGQQVPIVANLFAGTLARSSALEMALLASLDQLPSTHPILERFQKLGWIVDFDELARIDEMAQEALTGSPTTITLMICPTMGCNFDCPYCFEQHRADKMTEDTQDAVAALVGRMLEASNASQVRIDWFGGEPLLGADVIERLHGLINDACAEHGAGLFSHVVTNGYLLDEANARLLAKCRTKLVRITVDGTRETHDATRHLAGGGPTYDRIIENISRPLPFPVEVRMNVHAGNRPQMDALADKLESIAAQTGNRFAFRPSEVFDTEEAHGRADMPELMELDGVRAVSLNRFRMGFHGARGTHCAGQNPYDICIDEQGGLHSCQATLSRPDKAFGDAWSWNPADPVATATRPEMLAWFKRDSWAVNIERCRACLWLPLCMGGCSFERSKGNRDCIPWKGDPQGFVLTQYARIGEKRRDWQLTPQMVAEKTMRIFEKWGVARAWVHGSVVLGTMNGSSDVDLIVEMPPGKHLGYGIFGLRKELREALGRKVDLHTPLNDLSAPAVAAFIRRHQVLVYEADGQRGRGNAE